MACAEKAREKGFNFFGIQFYTECWSGTGAEKTYGRDGTSKDCKNGFGKSGANFVYRFSDYGECEVFVLISPKDFHDQDGPGPVITPIISCTNAVVFLISRCNDRILPGIFLSFQNCPLAHHVPIPAACVFPPFLV